MRAHDGDDRPPRDRPLQCVDMLGQIGTGIDDRDFALTDQISLRAVIGEGGRVMGEHAGDARLEFFEFRVGRVHRLPPVPRRVDAC